MAYIDVNNILKEISNKELAQLTGDSSGLVINPDRIAQAINSGGALIDSYLLGIYDVPFTLPTDDTIIQLSVTLAIVYLYEYEYRETFIPVPIIQRKISAIRTLGLLQTGEVRLMIEQRRDSKETILFNSKQIDDL